MDTMMTSLTCLARQCLATVVLSVLCATASAAVLPMNVIVAPNSTYALTLFGAGGQSTFSNVVFDGNEQVYSRGGQQVHVNESQSDLGNGLFQILLSISANGDLFPGTGNALFNLGFPGDPLNLLEHVKINSAVVSFSGPDVNYTSDFVSFFPASAFWDGYFTGRTQGVGYLNVGGTGINRIDVDVQVARVPEPGSIALMCIALFGFAAVRFQANRGSAIAAPRLH